MPVSKKRGRIGPSKWEKRKRRTRWGPIRFGRVARIRRPRPGKFVKKVMMAMSESKRVDKSMPFTSNENMAHDSIYEVILHTTDQGNTTCVTNISNSGSFAGRIGDEVYSTGFRVRGSFGIPFDRRNTVIKIWLLEYNTNQGSPTTEAQFYRSITGNNMLDPINNDRFPGLRLLRKLECKAKDLYVERGEVTDAGSIHQLYYDAWIPFKRKFRYNGNTNNVPPISGSKERLSLIATAYDTASTLTTDVIVNDHKQVVTWFFKDF